MRHIYWDLRPYTCIIDGCDADPFHFTSRADFKAHLIGHQVAKIWKCKNCGHPEESLRAARYHIAYAHRSSCSLNDDDDFDQQEVRRDLAKQICPFCNKIPGQANFVGHICHHLEDISLSAIPREGDLDESDKSSNGRVSVVSSDKGGSVSSALQDFVLDEEKSQGKSSSDTLDNLETAQQEVSNAQAHVQEGRHLKAEDCFIRAVAILEPILGEKHKETLLTQMSLAWTLQRQGKYSEAENIYRKILGPMIEVFGTTHRETLAAQNGFAIVLTDQGRYVEAEALSRQVLRGREDTLPPDNHYTLQSINNLAEVLEGQDRLEEAKVLYERAIEGRKRVLGEGHMFTQQSINMLAKMIQKIEGV
jgi:Tfp pilus assembly protein PilF